MGLSTVPTTARWIRVMKTYTYADMFSGCGGLSLGLALAGLRGRFAIERDPMAFATFSHNFLRVKGARYGFEWPAWLEPKAWDIEELLALHSADLSSLRGTIDVLAGGPPCQGFSFAGRRVEDDPRNLLFEKYVRVVDLVRPRAIVIENVPGMKVLHSRRNVLPLKGGNATPTRKSFFEKLVESLEEVGYVVVYRLVDASGFGVPQKRSRLIVIGLRREMAAVLHDGAERVFEFIEEARQDQLRDLGLLGPVSAEDAISDLETHDAPLAQCTDPLSPRGFQETEYRGPRTKFQELMNRDLDAPMDSMRLARHRDDVKARFARIIGECRPGVRMDDKSRASFGLRKHRIFPMSRSDPGPTITTLPDDILHYSEPRILTVRECARLQSFPDWFAFKGKYTTGGDRRTKECPRYTQVGNAVPPLLARAIGDGLRRTLEEVELNKRIFGMGHETERLAVSA